MTRQFEKISLPSEELDPVPSSPKSWRPQINWRSVLWQRKIGPAFWTFTGIISLVVNLVLLVVLIVVGRDLFTLKTVISDQLIGGLYTNFVKMDAAQINTTVSVEDIIVVQDTIPVQFTLPVQTDTNVILTENTPIEGAIVTIITPYFTLNRAPADIILPAGTSLPIQLDILVPVDTTIPVTLNVPVNLSVPVNIPLNQTELHEPFVGLQEVVLPYSKLLSQAPSSWNEALCTSPGMLCDLASQDQ